MFLKKRHIFGSYYDGQRPINGLKLCQKQDLLTVSLSFNLTVRSVVIKQKTAWPLIKKNKIIAKKKKKKKKSRIEPFTFTVASNK